MGPELRDMSQMQVGQSRFHDPRLIQPTLCLTVIARHRYTDHGTTHTLLGNSFSRITRFGWHDFPNAEVPHRQKAGRKRQELVCA